MENCIGKIFQKVKKQYMNIKRTGNKRKSEDQSKRCVLGFITNMNTKKRMEKTEGRKLSDK